MNRRSLAEFADMGGHAPYVWGAYAMVAGAQGCEAVMLQRPRRALQHRRERRADRHEGTD